MAELPKPKKTKNLFQWLAERVKRLEHWTVETFAEPLRTELKDDLGLNPANPATPKPAAAAHAAKIDAFVAKQEKESAEAALLAIVPDLKATAETILTFHDAFEDDA